MNANTERMTSDETAPIEQTGELEGEIDELQQAVGEPEPTQALEPSKVIGKLGAAMKTPSAAATITGAVVLGAATVFGVLETAVAGAAAYGAYRLFRKKRRSSQAQSQQREAEQAP
jgi:hypothetical protein